jgi:hypothetical protein
MFRLKWAASLLAWLAALTVITPPGLCPCWLFGDVDTVHVHPASDEHRPHGHAYLLEIFNAHLPATLPSVVSSAALIALLLASALSFRPARVAARGRPEWFSPVELPPPRAGA